MNKLTKVLSVFIIAGAVGASVAGVAGCKKGHSHSLDSTKWTDNYDGTHDGHCSCGHLMVDDEEHVIEDGECIKCHAPEGGHEHEYDYTDNGDGTHNGTCVCGKESIVDEPHKYVDGTCACGAEQGPVVESVTINGVTAIEEEMTINLTATVTGSTGVSQKVIWSVTNGTGEATITEEGALTAVSAGTVTVKATSKDDRSKSDEKTITISAQTDYGRLMKRSDKLTVLDGTYTVGTKLSTLEDYAIKGIYFRPQTGGSTAATDPARDYVEVIKEGDVLALKQHGSDGKTTGLPNVYTEIVIGGVKGTVAGYFETKISALTKGDAGDSGQNPIAFLNNGSAALTINAKGGTLSYKVGSGDLTAISGVTLAEETYVKVYFVFDLENGKTTLKLNDTVVMNEVATGITSIDCVELATSNKGNRVQTTKNIVVCGTQKDLNDSKADAKAKIAAELEKYDTSLYTINGSELTAAKTEADKAIEDATDIDGVNKAVLDGKAAMAAVLKDSDIEEARTNALSALTTKYPDTLFTLENLTGDDAKYNNASLYTPKIEEVTAALADLTSGAEMKAITDAADEYFAARTDAAMLTAKIGEVKAALETYATTYKAEHCAGNADKEAAADNAVIAQKTVLDGSSSIADANTKLEAAKAEIAKAVANVGRDPQEVKNEAITEINGYKATEIAAIGTGYGEYTTLISAAKTAATDTETGSLKTASVDEVATIVANVKSAVDRYLDNYAAHKAADEYKAEKAATVKNNTVKADIQALDFLNLFKEANAETRADATLNANKAVDDKVASLATYRVAVTVGTNEVCYVTYGTHLTLSDLHVSGFNVTAATLNGKQVPATASEDEDLTVYNPVTVTISGKTEIAGFAASATWKVAADASAPTEGKVIDNALFAIIAPTGTTYGAANSGFTNVAGEPNALQYTVPKATLGSDGKVSVKGDNKANPYKIEVKNVLATLDISVLLSDSKASGSRTGSIYYSVDGGVTYTAASGTNAKIALTNVSAGTTVLIYADNASIKSSDGSTMDARLYLGKVEATIDESKVEKTVHVTWKGAGANGADVTEDYRYYDKITAPVPTNLGDNVDLDFWHIQGDENDKWTNGSSLTSGTYTYVAKTKTVAAVASIELTASATTVEIGGNVTLTAVVKDEGGATLDRTVTWDLGEYTNAEVSADGKLTLKSGAQAGDTITVKAKVGSVSSAAVTITVAEASKVVFDASTITAETDLTKDLGNGFYATAEGVTAGAGKLTLGGTIGVSNSQVRRAVYVTLGAGTYTVTVKFNGGGSRTIKVGVLNSGSYSDLKTSDSISKGNGITGTVSGVTLSSETTIYIGANNGIDILSIEITKTA